MTFIRVFGYLQYFPLYFIPLFCLSYPQLLVHNAIIQTWMRDKLTHSWARMRLISQKKQNNGVCKVTGGECGCFQTSPPLSWFSSPAGNIYMHEVAQHFAISLLKSYSSQTVNMHFLLFCDWISLSPWINQCSVHCLRLCVSRWGLLIQFMQKHNDHIDLLNAGASQAIMISAIINQGF